MVTKLKVAPGDAVAADDVIAAVLDGDEVRDVGASRDGVIKELLIQNGQFVQSGAPIAETSARPFAVFSSMFSAVLGTMAFSALTMLFFIRKTNILEWLVLAVATVLLYWPGFLTDGAGLLLVGVVYLSQKHRGRKEAEAAA